MRYLHDTVEEACVAKVHQAVCATRKNALDCNALQILCRVGDCWLVCIDLVGACLFVLGLRFALGCY
jgi:hypothetical protein